VLLPGKIRVARQFLRAVRALHPAPAEAARAQNLVARYTLWYQGDRYALVALRQHNQEAFINVQEGADHWLAAAESVATSLGAPECSRRPFESP
jgi:nucleotide-binding universal stress UspA family protein